jgi:hypothetical protein
MSELVPRQDSIVTIIRETMASDKSPEYLQKLLDVRREWEADEARKTFNIAISEFQKRAPIVAKLDKAYDKDYARMDRIWRETRPLITELGLSVSWQICELRDGMCHVEGMLRHRDGHGEKLTMDTPLPELLKGQNKAQQMGSASTYAKRYAFCSALGIVTGENDDAHAAGTAFLSFDQSQEINDMIDACRGLPNWNEKAFWEWVNASSATEIEAGRYADVKRMLSKKLNPAAAK